MVVIGIVVGLKLKNEPLVTVAPKEMDTKTEADEILGQGRMEEILRYVDAKYVDGFIYKDFITDAIHIFGIYIAQYFFHPTLSNNVIRCWFGIQLLGSDCDEWFIF